MMVPEVATLGTAATIKAGAKLVKGGAALAKTGARMYGGGPGGGYQWTGDAAGIADLGAAVATDLGKEALGQYGEVAGGVMDLGRLGYQGYRRMTG